MVPTALEKALAEFQRQLRALTLARTRASGDDLLAGALIARGTGKVGLRLPCARGAEAGCNGYRPKEVQTLVGWITLRRTYYWCPRCGAGEAPPNAALGSAADSQSPGVRRLASWFGTLLSFAPAAEAAGGCLSAGMVRAVTEAVGAEQEGAVLADDRGMGDDCRKRQGRRPNGSM